MRISLDTNILVYASLNDGFVRSEVYYICSNHTLVLSQYVIKEYLDVIERKNIQKYSPINILNNINYITIDNANWNSTYIFEIRDCKDYQVLFDAIVNDVDILITNDKDFNDTNVKKPRIMNSKQFSEEFMQ